ncbi:AAA family ATPase [Endozoicomonas sp. 2B-B]
MLKSLTLTNVGPAEGNQAILFAPRLNLITGDNGLGKSFLLDIAWWALTRKWPQEVNYNLTSGYMARPVNPEKPASIGFESKGKSRFVEVNVPFRRTEQQWVFPRSKPALAGLVLYALPNGGFAVWDPARNYSDAKTGAAHERRAAYVFTPENVWDGLEGGDGKPLCNGLIQDWAGWQKEKGETFALLQKVLAALSPSPEEPIEAGQLARISLNDSRDIPTLKMPYGHEVPVIHASSGMKRIIALAYLLVWAWREHLAACKLLGQTPTQQIIFLIDEIEAHLHPKWQRSIIVSLLEVVKLLVAKRTNVQLITATHSPLVMASVEPFFDAKKDGWLDLNFEIDKKGRGCAVISETRFVRQGNANNWLSSEAFDLKSSYSQEAEAIMEEAGKVLSSDSVTSEQVGYIDKKLRTVLSDTDPFWMRWRSFAEKKGWLGD